MTSFTDAWNTTYQGLPPDSEAVSVGANRIRNLKVDITQRMVVDHSWDDGLTTNSNDGKHIQATLRVSSVKPTLDATDGAIYTKVVSGTTELFYEDSAGREVQLTAGGAIDLQTFASGTVLPFYQAVAPSGWTQVTGHDDRVLRVHDAGGGADGGSWTISGVTVSTVDSGSTATTTIATHTLTSTEIPAHTHTVTVGSALSSKGPGSDTILTPPGSLADITLTSSSTGGGGAHGHAGSTTSLSLHMTSTVSADGSWRPAYSNVILASKN